MKGVECSQGHFRVNLRHNFLRFSYYGAIEGCQANISCRELPPEFVPGGGPFLFGDLTRPFFPEKHRIELGIG